MPEYEPTTPKNRVADRELFTRRESDLRELDESMDWYEEPVLSAMTPSHIKVEGVVAGPMLAARLSKIKHPVTRGRSKSERHVSNAPATQRGKTTSARSSAPKTPSACATSHIPHHPAPSPYTPRRPIGPTPKTPRVSDGHIIDLKIVKTPRSKSAAPTLRRKKVVSKAMEE